VFELAAGKVTEAPNCRMGEKLKNLSASRAESAMTGNVFRESAWERSRLIGNPESAIKGLRPQKGASLDLWP